MTTIDDAPRTATNPYELLTTTYTDTTTAWGWLAREQRYLPLAWGASTSHNGIITTWTSPSPTIARLIAQATLHRHQISTAAAALTLLTAASYPTIGPLAIVTICTLTLALAATLATTVTSTTLTDRDTILATLLALHPTQPTPTALPTEILAALGRTVITHHRPDGTVFRTHSQQDRDAVAAMLCDLATNYAHGQVTPAALADIAEHLPTGRTSSA